MIVSKKDFHTVLNKIRTQEVIALDLETTGVTRKDSLFSIAISTYYEDYYFDFKGTLPRELILEFSVLNDCSIIYIHNAKFDLFFLEKEGVRLNRPIIHCTYALARIEYNQHILYSLDACASRIGVRKSDEVKKWILKNKAYTWETTPGKKTRRKNLHFDKVPLEIISKYAMLDSAICFALGNYQRSRFDEMDKIGPLVRNEYDLTKTCFQMEELGAKIDRKYCERAIEYYEAVKEGAEKRLNEIMGIEFKDSPKALQEFFSAIGYSGGKTEKGNTSFDDSYLGDIPHPAAKLILDYRDALKKANTYFKNYLHYADKNDVIHPNFKQGGTATGRFSCDNPNLQNIPARDEDTSTFPVRKCFIPREGYTLYSIDYEQMEYRMLLDMAGEMKLIEEVKKGLDIHEATGKLLGISRADAKAVNFGLVYGQGVGLLAENLKKTKGEAKAIKENYFRKLPNVQRLIKEIMEMAGKRGNVMTWLKRRSYFPNKDFFYKAPNYVIQGGCADIMKSAMNEIQYFLTEKKYKTRMILNIHDEIIFEVFHGEEHILQAIVNIMVHTYPNRFLPMACSVSMSEKSLGELKEVVLPLQGVEEKRNSLEREGA